MVTYDQKERGNLVAYNKTGSYPVLLDEPSIAAGVRHLLDKVDGPVFVCLPTPMLPGGDVDLSIVRAMVHLIDEVAGGSHSACGTSPVRRDVILKSTVPPGTTESLQGRFTNVVFCPEFLREVSAEEDFQGQDHVILGGEPSASTRALFYKALPDATQILVAPRVAEMCKYVVNCFLATKVSFANEMRQVCDAAGVDYAQAVACATLDPRLGKSHWEVPGPDGHRGFGGSCFPKDLNGMIRFAQGVGVIPNLLEAAWENNLRYRPERDWEQLKGRAVAE